MLCVKGFYRSQDIPPRPYGATNFNMEHSSLFLEQFGLCLETNFELIFQ